MGVRNQKIKMEPSFEKYGDVCMMPDIAHVGVGAGTVDTQENDKFVQKCLFAQNVFRNLQEKEIKKILKKGVRRSYKANDVISAQGDAGGVVFFILNGSVDVLVNGCRIGTRRAKECIGEMSAIDPTQKRCATLEAAESCSLFEMPSDEFDKICKDYPQVLMNECVELCERLRERSKFHISPNPVPELFIGSSKEGLCLAKKFQRAIEKAVPGIKVLIWDKGVFGLSKNNLDSLVMEAKKCDFAIMVMTADDSVKSRGSTCKAPRDNVVFELGLFMGTIGSDRTFLIRPPDLKLPTDLDGITYVEVSPNARTIPSAKLEQIVRVLEEKGTKK